MISDVVPREICHALVCRKHSQMEITGHKTRSMYRRYRIVDERDLREATARLKIT
jgi:hypothetical protein